jgi:hypothetical protein
LVVLAEVLNVAISDHWNSESSFWINVPLDNFCNLVLFVEVLGSIEYFANGVWDVVYVPTLQMRGKNTTICSTVDELSTMMFFAPYALGVRLIILHLYL